MRALALALGIIAFGTIVSVADESLDDRLQALAYPKAERYDDSPGGGGIRHARYATPDKPSAVGRWYRKALDYAGPDGSETGASEVLFNPIRDSDSGYRASVQYITRKPGKGPGEIGEPRPVQEILLVKRTLSAVSIVVISRGEEEDRTFITLTLIDNVGK